MKNLIRQWKALVIGSVLTVLVLERAISLVAYGATCGAGHAVSRCGSIIIDNTPNPGQYALVTNMTTNLGATKSFGNLNNFTIDGIQVMQRQGDTQSDITVLVDEIGVTNTASTSYENYGTSNQLKYFADGTHLFDLDRFRATADWLASSVSATATHPAGSYGTISWRQFAENVSNQQTMYGIVRIKVPLELGTCTTNGSPTGTHCTTNALGATVPTSTLYGFCRSSSGLCANAPNETTNIKSGGLLVPGGADRFGNGAQIKVRGALMFDFVDNMTGLAVPLSTLAQQPRSIYFKVEVPININAANDRNGDGIMDNINYIDSITSGKLCATPPCSITVNDPINFNQVPQEAKDAFQYQFGVPLDSTLFDSLSEPNQYHLLMPSGYAQGWHDAFQELAVTSSQWKGRGFDAPNAGAADGILSVDEIRSDLFEDIPVYIYTGGLVDMHGHVNISGLVYVPQSMELEQNVSAARQFIMGAVIVRDGFFLKGDQGSTTILSSDPTSFASVRVRPNSSSMGFTLAGEPGAGGGTGEPIVGNPARSTELSGGGGGGGGSPGLKRWAEVRPR